jgi:GTP-binding protein HflX
LAQLQYTAPRLRGMWTHLERIAGAGGGTGVGSVGGIGTRGPGERQIEIDRRIVRDRISMLRHQIAEIDQRKTREVLARSDEFQVTLVGYTNSGKSTLMNALTGAGQLAEDKLFATLDTKTTRWQLGEARTALLSDTVGFVRDLPHHLVASFRATLEETIHANFLLHVVDAAAPEAGAQIETVLKVLDELGCHDTPKLTLFNKMDAAEDLALIQVLEQRYVPSLRISARSGAGLEHLITAVIAAMRSADVHATLRTSVRDGRLLAAIEQKAHVLDRRFFDEQVEMDVRINRTHLEQLLGRHPGLTVVKRGIDAPAGNV